MKPFKKFLQNTMGGTVIGDVVILVVALFMVGILLGPALGTLFNQTTTNWDATSKTVAFTLLPSLAVLSIGLMFIFRAIKEAPT